MNYLGCHALLVVESIRNSQFYSDEIKTTTINVQWGLFSLVSVMWVVIVYT